MKITHLKSLGLLIIIGLTSIIPTQAEVKPETSKITAKFPTTVALSNTMPMQGESLQLTVTTNLPANMQVKHPLLEIPGSKVTPSGKSSQTTESTDGPTLQQTTFTYTIFPEIAGTSWVPSIRPSPYSEASEPLSFTVRPSKYTPSAKQTGKPGKEQKSLPTSTVQATERKVINIPLKTGATLKGVLVGKSKTVIKLQTTRAVLDIATSTITEEGLALIAQTPVAAEKPITPQGITPDQITPVASIKGGNQAAPPPAPTPTPEVEETSTEETPMGEDGEKTSETETQSPYIQGTVAGALYYAEMPNATSQQFRNYLNEKAKASSNPEEFKSAFNKAYSEAKNKETKSKTKAKNTK